MLSSHHNSADTRETDIYTLVMMVVVVVMVMMVVVVMVVMTVIVAWWRPVVVILHLLHVTFGDLRASGIVSAQ